MPARRDEVQIAANAGLGRVNIAKVMRSVDDPELLVAGGEVENLLVFGQDDECRKPQLGVDGDNVFLRVLHDTRRDFRRGMRGYRAESGHAKSNDGEDAKEKTEPLTVKDAFHRNAPFEMDWPSWNFWSRTERISTKHCTVRRNAVTAPHRAKGRNGYSGSRRADSSKWR